MQQIDLNSTPVAAIKNEQLAEKNTSSPPINRRVGGLKDLPAPESEEFTNKLSNYFQNIQQHIQQQQLEQNPPVFIDLNDNLLTRLEELLGGLEVKKIRV